MENWYNIECKEIFFFLIMSTYHFHNIIPKLMYYVTAFKVFFNLNLIDGDGSLFMMHANVVICASSNKVE